MEGKRTKLILILCVAFQFALFCCNNKIEKYHQKSVQNIIKDLEVNSFQRIIMPNDSLLPLVKYNYLDTTTMILTSKLNYAEHSIKYVVHMQSQEYMNNVFLYLNKQGYLNSKLYIDDKVVLLDTLQYFSLYNNKNMGNIKFPLSIGVWGYLYSYQNKATNYIIIECYQPCNGSACIPYLALLEFHEKQFKNVRILETSTYYPFDSLYIGDFNKDKFVDIIFSLPSKGDTIYSKCYTIRNNIDLLDNDYNMVYVLDNPTYEYNDTIKVLK
jgi:hypothetical protein